jgi:hypothetical protein
MIAVAPRVNQRPKIGSQCQSALAACQFPLADQCFGATGLEAGDGSADSGTTVGTEVTLGVPITNE